jgi:hypothetical protein
MGKWTERALELRRVMNQAGEMLTDAQASEVAAIYPVLMEDGSLIKAGTRINWEGKLMRAASDLWDRPENNPDNAPALWEEINYREGYRVIPETITAGTAFAKGERGWWGDVLYESVFDGQNVWTPEAYPGGWAVVSA